MRPDEYLVGGVAVILAIIATSISAGPWLAPYRLRSISHLESRYGKRFARLAWLLIAVMCGSCGVAILKGLRPNYAVPANHDTGIPSHNE